MSWDVVLLDSHVPLTVLPKDFDESIFRPLGPLPEVRATIKELFPSVDFTDPSWGDLEDSEYTIEFNIGKDDPVTSILLHIRGEDVAIEAVMRLCRHTGWCAFGSEGLLIDFSNDPARGLREWRAFLDKGIEKALGEGKRVVVGPRINGVRFDMWVEEMPQKPRRSWWQFWRRTNRGSA